MKNIKDFNFKNKNVLVRCDFNVPIDEKGEISEDFRIKETLPTIQYLAKKGAKIILISHLGEPKEAKNREEMEKKFSLKPIAERLEKLLKMKIKFLPDCLGPAVEKEISQLKEGEVVLLENLRFYEEEKKNEENFARNLAKLADIYINDAFSVCHRVHASIVGLPKYLPSAAGFLLEKEIKVLTRVLENPWHPLVVIIGGAKIESKMGVIEQFLKKADHLLLGGEIANSVLVGKGICLGSLFFENKEIVEKIEKIDLTSPKIHLPIDGVITLASQKENYFRQGAIGSVKKEEKVFDIGPETIKVFSKIIKEAKMILWSGPLGMFEKKEFENGTKEIAQIITRNHLAFKIVGGGDTISAVDKFGLLEKFDHVSTGGGAMLEFLSGKTLPGLESLK